jgi:hypothetical protein
MARAYRQRHDRPGLDSLAAAPDPLPMSIQNDVEEYLADLSQFPDWQGAVWKIRRQLIELGRVADEQQAEIERLKQAQTEP